MIDVVKSKARIMRKNKRASFTQSYNAQAAVDADGSQLVVGQHISQSAGDYAELANGVASIPSQLGKPKSVLADAGYVNADAFDRLEKEDVEIYCSVHREDAHNERHYDFRPEKASGEWTLVCLAYNLKRLHGMVGSVTNGAGGPKSPSMARKPSGISLVSDWLG